MNMYMYYRFPMKNKAALKSWEQFVQQVHHMEVPWKATDERRICSNHFQQSDYIIPPSQNGTCRLKKYVIPSISNNVHVQSTIISTTHPDALLNKLGLSNKRPLSATLENNDNTSPPEKIFKTTSTEEKRDMLQKKLEQKIRNLQQQLRRTKQKVETMSEVVKILKDKLVINSKEAESLLSTFNDTHLGFLYNFKDNIECPPSRRRYSDEIKEFALTLYFYSPKAYKYVRSIVPLPNPSLIKKCLLPSNVIQVLLKMHFNHCLMKLLLPQIAETVVWLLTQCRYVNKRYGILKTTNTQGLLILETQFQIINQRD